MTDNKYTSYSQINIGDTVLFMGKKVLVSDLDLDNSYAALAWWDNNGELVMHPIIEEQIRLLERVEPEAKEPFKGTDLGAGEDATVIHLSMPLSDLRIIRSTLESGSRLTMYEPEEHWAESREFCKRALKLLPNPFTQQSND